MMVLESFCSHHDLKRTFLRYLSQKIHQFEQGETIHKIRPLQLDSITFFSNQENLDQPDDARCLKDATEAREVYK